MPGVTVVPVNSDDSITAGGSIHCTTQTIPALAARTVPGTYFPVAVAGTPAPDFSDMAGELPSLTGLKAGVPFLP